jgi:hypothetical protein
MIGSCPDWSMYTNISIFILLTAIPIVIGLSAIAMILQGRLLLQKSDDLFNETQAHRRLKEKQGG